MNILPLSATYFVVQEGFIYTITVDIHTFHLAFSTILPSILHHFTLHLAPKQLAFCTKTHCI